MQKAKKVKSVIVDADFRWNVERATVTPAFLEDKELERLEGIYRSCDHRGDIGVSRQGKLIQVDVEN